MEEAMSEEIKEMNPDDKNHKKDSDGYEKICYLCHRPESKVDKMITCILLYSFLTWLTKLTLVVIIEK